MNGKEFALLVKLIGDAKLHGVFSYAPTTVSKLEREFVSYQAENAHFSVSDLLYMLTAFERISDLNNMHRLIETVIDQVPSAIKNSDSDMLKLFKRFNQLGILKMEKYEKLCHFLQDYACSRFEFMDKDQILDFAEFMQQIGLWHWDQMIMSQIEAHFSANYVQYDVTQMCRIVNLVGSNYLQSEDLLSLIEDSLKLRLNHMVKNELKTDEFITGQNLNSLAEGLSALGDASRKRLFSLMKTMVILAHRGGRKVLIDEQRLLVKFIKVLADMQVSVGKELKDIIDEAVEHKITQGAASWDKAKF